jgi:sugar phosphate isomerase/epimerase
MKYSISNWIYGGEALDLTFQRLQRLGYDGVELMGEPTQYDPADVISLCRAHRLSVLSIAGMYPYPTDSRDLASPDPAVRGRAVEYLEACVNFAAAVAAPLVIVVPSAVAKTTPTPDVRDEAAWDEGYDLAWRHAVAAVRAATRAAEAKRVFLAIEPINRYETFLVNTCEQAMRFVDEVGSDAVGVHLDTFHMNIEEADPAAAVRLAGRRLLNVHVSDSNRQAVGRGHTDFRALLRALRDIGYDGTLTLEPLPPLPDPYIAARMTRLRHLWDRFAEESLQRLKALEGEIT